MHSDLLIVDGNNDPTNPALKRCLSEHRTSRFVWEDCYPEFPSHPYVFEETVVSKDVGSEVEPSQPGCLCEGGRLINYSSDFSFLILFPQNMLRMSRVCLHWKAFYLSQLTRVSRRVSTPNKAEL